MSGDPLGNLESFSERPWVPLCFLSALRAAFGLMGGEHAVGRQVAEWGWWERCVVKVETPNCP